ncbi:MipA/OmpV family protein [Roseateles sp. UC29_93]|uniref:MipA/OmpV family protein n=1 Tax=Roseateles sp. UC29_93 TaxID=3350177 RepID=UPI003670FD3A
MAPQTRFLSHAPRALTRAVFSSAAVLCVSAPLSALAAGAGGPGGPGDKDGDSSWGLGVGAVISQKAYTGYDRKTRALPMISYENRWVKVAGPGLTVKLPSWTINPSQRVDFGLVAKLDLSGYEQDDAPILNGMAERKGGLWAGAKAEWKTDLFELGGEWTADASGHSKGQKFALTLEKSWRVGQQVMLTPRLGANWVDKKYVDYYYGVRAAEVRAGRAFYQGKSTTNAEVGLRTMYLFNPHHAMFLDLSVTALGSGIKDSPLVDRSTENRLFVGYQYRF